MHTPELMLQLHNVERAELYEELRARARGKRPGLARRAWPAVARTIVTRAGHLRRLAGPSPDPGCAACAA